LEDVYGLGLAFKQRMIIRWSALDDYGLDDPGISNPNDPGVVDSWTVSFTFGGDDVNISARINLKPNEAWKQKNPSIHRGRGKWKELTVVL
jgi:hypothetical protein